LAVGKVKWYMHEIRSKLGVKNSIQAVMRAQELHLL
jgi:ATP/maltotriose-dependent transcriptional regulator MalT